MEGEQLAQTLQGRAETNAGIYSGPTPLLIYKPSRKIPQSSSGPIFSTAAGHCYRGVGGPQTPILDCEDHLR